MTRFAILALPALLAACVTQVPIGYNPAYGIPVGPAAASTGISLGAGQSRGILASTGGSRRVQAPAEAANQFAVSFLSNLQARSFAEHREFCGYFVVDALGNIAATPPVGGTLAGCSHAAPTPDVFASYHTHGAYDRGYDNEVPSIPDLQGDFQFGMDGYVSTPGGRVWHIEYDDRTARQLCGQGCVTVDPGFVPEDEAGIRQSYTVRTLAQR